MTLINCPVCTFLNNPINTNCDCCDSLLRNDLNIEQNPFEYQFMSITGESRSVAKQYLDLSTQQSINEAVDLYYQKKNWINLSNDLVNIFSNLVNRINEKPKNIEDLTCQLIYTRGRNAPHYCTRCDSKAFLICVKIFGHLDNQEEIISMIPYENLINLKEYEENKSKLLNDLLKNIKNVFLPKIILNLINYFEISYTNREKFLEKYSLQQVDDCMNNVNGLDFRIIWDTIHLEKEKLDKEEIKESLENLIYSSEFQDYLNESWETNIYNHPASSETIKNLKKIKLSKNSEFFHKLKDSHCSICMEEFLPDNREVIVLDCHTFCSECILTWLENHNDTCPICRKKVSSKKLEKSEYI